MPCVECQKDANLEKLFDGPVVVLHEGGLISGLQDPHNVLVLFPIRQEELEQFQHVLQAPGIKAMLYASLYDYEGLSFRYGWQ